VHCFGVTNVLTILDAERTLLAAPDRLADRDPLTATALVAVEKARGGGWDMAPERADAQAP
jgi:outer membrane protein, multidrug efflux system